MSQSKRKASHWPISILSIFSAFLNMAMPLALVRLLSPSEIGLFKVFFLYLMLAPAILLSHGLFNGLAYWSGQSERRDDAMKATSTILFGVSLLAAGGFALFATAFSDSLGWPTSYQFAFALALFGVISGGFLEEASITTGRVWRGALFYSGFELTKTALIVGIALLTKDLETVLWVFAGLVVLKALVGFAWAFSDGLAGFSFSKDAFSGVLAYAFPVSLAGMFGVFVNSADQLILSTQLESSAFALYAIGCLSVPPLIILEHSITRVLIPSLSRDFSQGRNAEACRDYRVAVSQLGFLIIPAVCGLILFAEPIIRLLFTETYIAAAPFLQLYAIHYLFLLFPYDAVPRAKGEGKWILKNFAFFSLVTLLLCFLLSAVWGAFGALLGLLVSQGCMRGYGLYYAKRRTQWPLGSLIPFQALANISLVCLGLSAIALGMEGWFESDLMWFVVAGGVFTLLYFLIMAALFMSGRGKEANGDGLLVLVQHLDIGGLERMVLELCTELRNKTSRPMVVFSYDQSLTEDSKNLVPEFVARGIPVQVFKKRRGFSFAAVRRGLSLAREYQVGVIHSHDMGSLIYAVAVKLLSPAKVKLVHTQHSFVHLRKKRRYRMYERLFTLFVDELVVVSSDTEAGYRDIGLTRRIEKINNGILVPQNIVTNREDVLRIRRELMPHIAPALYEKRWVACLSRIHPVKGQRTLLEIWGKLEESVRQSSELFIVGPESFAGEQSHLLRLIEERDLNHVHLVGPTMSPGEWYDACDLFVSCSEFEGMPLGPLEAVSHGRSVLLSDIEGHRLLKDVSRQFSLNDLDAGVRLLEELIGGYGIPSDEALLQASEWVKTSFSISAMADAYLRLYQHHLEKVEDDGNFGMGARAEA